MSPQVVDALTDMVEHQVITVLDLTFLARQQDGTLRVIDLDDELHDLGLRPLTGRRRPLISSLHVRVPADDAAAAIAAAAA